MSNKNKQERKELKINKSTSKMITDLLIKVPEISMILTSYLDALGLDPEKTFLEGDFKIIVDEE